MILLGGTGAVGPGFVAGWLLVVAPTALAVVGATLRRSPRAALAGATAGVGAFAVLAVAVTAVLPGDEVALLLVPGSLDSPDDRPRSRAVRSTSRSPRAFQRASLHVVERALQTVVLTGVRTASARPS